MQSPPVWKRTVASFLVCALALAVSPALAVDDPAGVAGVAGEILSVDGNSAAAGTRVHFADSQTGASYASIPTGADGTFRVADLPPSTYHVGIESGGRLFVVDSALTLAPGQTRNVQLALQSKAPAAPAGVWQDPLYAGLIVAGSAIVLGVLINEATRNEDDGPVTQSDPD